ncbi:MAG: ABC transporter substrate-binding protein [Hasllibacter sp.]
MSAPRSDLLAALALAAGAACADAPARVVSINLCTDLLAFDLAAPGQLVSVSNLAVDPLASPRAAAVAASGLPLNAGRAEEVFLMDADLVLAGTWTTPATTAMLESLGVPVARFAPADSLDDVPADLRRMGALLGRAAEGEAAAARFEAALAAPAPAADAPRAALFYANGYTLGAGTLTGEILAAGGFRNVADEAGIAAGTLPLEVLVMALPDAVIGAEAYPGASRSEEVMSHPALDGAGARTRALSDATWVCGTPDILRAVGAVAAFRAEIGG